MAVKDRWNADEDDFERIKLDLFPLWVSAFMCWTRVFIISIRHGTTDIGTFQSMSRRELKPEDFSERLIAQAWIWLPPEVALSEIEKAMVCQGSTDKFLRFKTLTPIYPTILEKLTDKNYWDKFGWTLKKSMEQEKAK